VNPALTIVINMAVAGFVGGITNHYAIKMLFHPREEKRIGSWRVPFTPGLIPKRKEEIGRSLGKVVADHLVTTEGLQNLVSKPAFRSRIESRLAKLVDDWTSREDTVEELLLRFMPRERLDAGLDQAASWLKGFAAGSLDRLWTEGGWSERRLGELMPGWSKERRDELTAKAVRMMVEEIRKELDTLQGERMLRQMASQFMEQAGGFLGSLATIFMDGDKVVGKVKGALVQQLESQALQSFAANFIRERLIRLENMTLDEAARLASGGQDPREWLEEQAGRALSELRIRGWEKLAGMRLSDSLASRKDWLHERIPSVTARLLGLMSSNMARLVAAIELPLLVEEEVRKFPIEQVEEIILSVSGQEFRAITWLGVILGGIIGLFQSFLIFWQT
jgi:uncharacterized membrane protein YheB (UPF0754 family)